MDKARNKKIFMVTRNRYLESQMALLKLSKARRNKNIEESLFELNDPVYDDYIPNLAKDPELQ
jgi:hypothetical protein